ncbi:MAG: GNAT family acetyltransferase [Kordiimonadaceae bacterium]|nr:GNAT family acetyltransferase [Kordiimonadaceae bacterium]
MEISIFDINDQDEVINLWRDCGLLRAQNDPYEDIKRKINHSPELFYVGRKNGKIIATVMAGYEGRRGWINLLAVEPSEQKSGYVREIMNHAEQKLGERGCIKVNLQIRQTNKQAICFYQSLGYAEDLVLSMGKRL